MNDILLIRNNVEFFGKHKGVFERSFSKKDLGEATYILSIKIYRDRSRRLIYFQWVHTLTRFWSSSKWNSQRSSCPCCKVWSWVKTQNPTTAENRKRMKVIPYASAIGSIKYAMLCTRPIVYLAMSLARGYDSDPGVDHWTADKVILSYLRGLRKYFSVMEVIKNSS